MNGLPLSYRDHKTYKRHFISKLKYRILRTTPSIIPSFDPFLFYISANLVSLFSTIYGESTNVYIGYVALYGLNFNKIQNSKMLMKYKYALAKMKKNMQTILYCDVDVMQ